MGSVPELRFPEFSGEWREVKLGEITSKIGSGKTPTGGDKVYTKQGIPFIRSQNIIDNKLVLDNTHITKNTHNTMRNSIVFANDILLNITGGSIGRSCVVPPTFIEGNVNQHVSIIRLIDDKPEFIQSILSSWRGQKLIFQNQTGSGREGLNFENIKSFKVHIPSLPEQQKIADFLSAVDEKITLSQEKITRLEAYKKGMMQKLLSGELRFPGFTDAWREVKLGEISTISTGTSKSKFIQEKGKYLIVDMGSISSDGKLIASKKTNHNSDFLKAGILVMPKDDIGGGNIIGKTAYIDVDNKYIMGDHIYKISIIQDNSKFIHYLINSYKINKILRRRATGTAQLGLNKNSVSTVSFKLPSLPEQQKIADFLTAIDDKLTLEKERLEALKRYKQGLLQKMFV